MTPERGENNPSGGGDLPPIIGLPPAPANQRKLGWWLHLLLMAALPVAVFLLGFGQKGIRGPALTHTVPGLLAVCGIQLVIFFLLFLLAWLASRAGADDLLLRWRPGRWVIPLGLGYSIALRIALAILGILIVAILLVARVVSQSDLEHFTRGNAPDVEALVDVAALRHNPVYLFLTLTLVSFVLAGLREELWRSAFLAGFRRLWPGQFSGRAGELKAVLAAAVLFGSAHAIQGPVAVVVTGLLGLGLGWIMIYHRSIWPAVFAHGFFDALSLAAIPLVMDQLQQLRPPAH